MRNFVQPKPECPYCLKYLSPKGKCLNSRCEKFSPDRPPEDWKYKELSPTQQKVLGWLYEEGKSQHNVKGFYVSTGYQRQLAGDSMAPFISAAWALIRKGLAQHGWTHGCFAIAQAGINMYDGPFKIGLGGQGRQKDDD